MGHNSRKGDNSDKKKKIWVSYFSMRNPYMKFKTWACTVHKIWHTSDFILIFSKGHNSRKGDNSDKKKLHLSSIFPWGNHMWNFKTLACTVLEKRMDGRMHWHPKLICPVNFLWIWGHNDHPCKILYNWIRWKKHEDCRNYDSLTGFSFEDLPTEVPVRPSPYDWPPGRYISPEKYNIS